MVTVGIVAGVLGLGLVVAVVLGRGTGSLTSGRTARLMRVGNLSARMWTTWVGSRIRKLFAGKEAGKRIDAAQRKANAERVAETMGQMKGAFMKLGQMMSFITDDLPEEYRTALSMLQASAPPMDLALLRDVAEQELGKPLERAFARFDPTPIASASIGQVHRAQLPTGEEVVVKIQYPGVAEAIRGDLANVAVLYRMIGMFYPGVEPGPIVDELRGRISEELDYVNEAKNQRAFHELYQDHPFIRVPRVYDSHSTARVLTSEYVEGQRYADVLQMDRETQQRYGEILYRFIFGSITRFGVFNGDPHPGNYLFADGKVVFLDFGCVKYFPTPMRRNWKELVAAHLSEDRQRFKTQLTALNFIKAADDLDAETLYDFFGYFYEPFHLDREFTYTREYNQRSFAMILKPEGKFVTLGKKLNMPADFVFVNRIQWGVVSLLAQLEATANWHRVYREFVSDAPPSTELGRLDAEFRVRWRALHQLNASELALTPEGVRALG